MLHMVSEATAFCLKYYHLIHSIFIEGFSLFNFHNGFICKFAHVSEQCKLCWNYNHKIIFIFLAQSTTQNNLYLIIFSSDHQFLTEIVSVSSTVGETPWQDNRAPAKESSKHWHLFNPSNCWRIMKISR